MVCGMTCDDKTAETSGSCADLGLTETTKVATGCCKDADATAPAAQDETEPEARSLCCRD